MIRMKEKALLITGGVFLFFCYPIIINLIVQSPSLFGIEFSRDSAWIGYFSTFHGAIFGGIISGAFTFLGVRLTLFNQFDKEKIEKANRRKMLYTQLKFSCEMISSAIKMDDGNFNLDFIV